MDRKQLRQLLAPFLQKCADEGKAVEDICVEEAFPGDASTSYVIQVKAPWVDNMYCSDAIDFLFDRLWETTSEETRKKIFSIQVIDSKDKLHCWSDTEHLGLTTRKSPA
jgi:hypothetical protein